ncbi:MAG: hypothetical protein AAF937_06210 [Planctomycetota bacterium]
MLVTVEDFNGDDSWSITAEFLSTPPSPILQLWADTHFQLNGDGSPITITDYHPSYDTTLGPAVIENNGTDRVEFTGNANGFFGTPDPSNPLFVASFDYAGDLNVLDLELIGQNPALFDFPPFGDVRLYTGPLGQTELTFQIVVVPAPATLILAALATAVSRRRRP